MSAPQIKKGGRLTRTAQGNFGLADNTAVVCSAQEHCEHSDTRVEILPLGSLHFGKEVCRNCDATLRWLPKPASRGREHWHREAERLLAEFERSGDIRHFRALNQHLRGMRERGVAP